MNFVGRWIPAEVGYTLLIGWGITMIIIVGAYLWFKRNGPPPAQSGRDALSGRGRRKKHSGRNKRYR